MFFVARSRFMCRIDGFGKLYVRRGGKRFSLKSEKLLAVAK